MNFFTGSDKDFANSSLEDLIEGDFSDGDTDSDGDGNYDYYPDPTADADEPDLPPIADDSVEFDPDIFYEDAPVIPNYYTNQFTSDILTKYPNVNIPQPLDDDPDTAYDQITTALSASGMDVQSAILNIYLIDSDSLANSLDNISNLLFSTFNGDAIKVAEQLIVPELNISSQLAAGLEIPRSVLLPVDNNNAVIPGEVKTTLVFDVGNFFFNTKTGFGFDDALSLSFSPATPKAQIGNTGLIIGFTNAMLYTAPASNNPVVAAAGYSDDFVGLFVQQASISFGKFGSDDPNNPSASITGTNLLIGTGGFSGTIAVADQGIIYRNFGNFSVELDSFSLTFRQNAITNCAIAGLITLDKYTTNGQPSKIAITAQIKDAGDFSITAAPSSNFPPITLPGVFDLHIRTLTIGEEQPEGFYVEISGTLDFIADIPVLGNVLPKGINITQLRIWDDGTIDFRSGGLDLAVSFKLQIGPVKLEVSRMSLGSYNRIHEGISRNYSYFGFDGMVNTGNAGIEVNGNGIKFYFTIDD